MKTMNICRTAAFTLAAVFTLSACERPPVDAVQRGYRGNGMEQVVNPRLLADKVAQNMPVDPEPAAPVDPALPKASLVYQNVQILGDLSLPEFSRTMNAMSTWVTGGAKPENCNYCHEGNNFASDALYTKKVSRVMLSMTQRANQDWKAHVGDTGVTCYTCHRGNPVPAMSWTSDPGYKHASGMKPTGQNVGGVAAVANTSLPWDPLTTYLLHDNNIRVQSGAALPQGSTRDVKDTEGTYALMMHFSDSLGVNCTYCHNSRAFGEWTESPPTRLKAWNAIRQVREMNNTYIGSVTDILPAHRKGPLGDPLKVGCNTCHQGAYKPLYGAPMAPAYPGLLAVMKTTPPAPPAPPAEPAAAPEAAAAEAPAAGH